MTGGGAYPRVFSKWQNLCYPLVNLSMASLLPFSPFFAICFSSSKIKNKKSIQSPKDLSKNKTAQKTPNPTRRRPAKQHIGAFFVYPNHQFLLCKNCSLSQPTHPPNPPQLKKLKQFWKRHSSWSVEAFIPIINFYFVKIVVHRKQTGIKLLRFAPQFFLLVSLIIPLL